MLLVEYDPLRLRRYLIGGLIYTLPGYFRMVEDMRAAVYLVKVAVREKGRRNLIKVVAGEKRR